jgi:hypothetical protein
MKFDPDKSNPMNSFFSPPVFSTLLFLSLLSPTPQGWGGENDTDEAFFQIEFSLYTWTQQRFIDSFDQSAEQVEDLFFFSQGAWHKVRPQLGHRTSFMDYVGPSPFTLFRQTGESPEGEAMFTPYAEVKLESFLDRLVVILLPHIRQLSADGQYLALAVPIHPDAANFRPDEPVFYNLTQLELALRFNDENIIIPPQGSASLPVRNPHSRVQLQIAARHNGSWRMVRQTSVSLSPGASMMILIDADNEAERLSIRRLVLD